MAYINVAEWTTELVTDWLKGLDNSMYTYIKSFTNNEVRGQQLLNIRPYELEQLSMHSIGHQEIVLEAVEHLRNFHYHLDKENLQFLALQVATTAQCLHNQLSHFVDKSKIETQILSDITRTIATMKPLIGWLDRSPFQDKQQFVELRNKMFRYAIEMAMSAQRDRFVENPVDQIKMIALRVSNLANYIIQDISDPMILQPAMLNLVTIKKKESELGFNIVPSYHGIHVVTDIKNKSPAHTSGKIEEGDEIVQINYQTVVGWQYKKVIQLLQESAPDILITLKKRPKHTKIYGQIYMKPYRLPSKKKALRWDTSPSPRPDLLHIQDFSLPLTQVTEKQEEEPFDDDILDDADDLLDPKAKKCSEKEIRLYLPKSRAVLQRRNTICGDHVMGFKNNVLFWHEHRNRENSQESISQLRDKSVSFGFGLELATRPTTILGIGHSANSRFNDFSGLKGSMPDMPPKESTHVVDSSDSKEDEVISKPGISKVVRFDSSQIVTEYKDSQYSCNVDNTILEVFEPIPYVDDDEIDLLPIPRKTEQEKCDEKVPPMTNAIQKMSTDNGLIEAINETVVNKCATRRGRLDKSHSTPIYDDTDDDSDVPPAIEPRKEFLQKTPPVPPRPVRPKKLADLSPVSTAPVPTSNTQLFVKANNKAPNDLIDDNKPKLATVIDLKNKENFQSIMEHLPERAESRTSSIGSTTSSKKIPATKHFLEEYVEESELLTPNKTKNLTLKKKNSILAKRRNISLKTLEMGDIQGHLYRRAKDKHGVTYWAKPYFVLTDTSLYGFKSKDSSKADCLIFLLGFTVALAPEVHSKPFAFKVYHRSKTFYFAAESQQALNQWMDYIRQATLKGSTATLNQSPNRNDKELFSETESSGDEFGLSQKTNVSPSLSRTVNGQQNAKKSGADDVPNNVGKHEKYNLGFGSLKKFTKHSLPFSSHKKDKEKLNSSDVPVPTAQYRSYRKVPGNAGLQLGTSSMISSTGTNDFVPPLLSSVDASYKNEAPKKASITILQSTQPTIAESTSLHRYQREHTHHENRKLQKVSPCNYIHASNPNLLEFDFPTSKTLDFSYPKVNPSNSWDAHSNVQGFMTLKDLMLQKQEEEAQEMYNNRVLLGVEKKTNRTHKRKQHRPDQLSNLKQEDELNGGGSSKQNTPNKIQSRSLPKTPDYSHSFKPTDSDIKMIRSSEGQKLREFGYELISENDPVEKSVATNCEEPKQLQDKISSGKKKGLNWISNERKVDDERTNRTGSFKKSKRKLVSETLDSFKATEKLFPFKHKVSENDLTAHNQKPTTHQPLPLKPVTSYSPLTLPLNKKTAHVYNIEVDGSQPRHQVNIKKSSTYNSPDFRSLQSNENGVRKNSAPERGASYFTKLTFTSNKTAKEKKLLGSPRLHRAIFGRKESSETQHLDHELFSPIDPIKTKAPLDSPQEYRHSPLTPKTSLTTSTHSTNSNDYPHLEYPPTFEPQTYSLSDPNTSLTMIRRRNNNQNK